MRIQVPIVIEMNDQQVCDYAKAFGLGDINGKVTAKELVDDVRSYVLNEIQESAAFGEIGDGNGTRGADVSIKR